MTASPTGFSAGQSWSYRTPEGFETSRILIGAVASFSDGQRVFCCAVTGAPERQPDGGKACVAIPFLPMTEDALTRTVTTRDETTAGVLPHGFSEAFTTWRDDPRGLSCFTVPFEGYLDRLIARQMAAIIGSDAA
ncbi:MAG: hypothetical protein AB7U75_11250 [Hyphomicrobiaceae bacterium]